MSRAAYSLRKKPKQIAWHEINRISLVCGQSLSYVPLATSWLAACLRRSRDKFPSDGNEVERQALTVIICCFLSVAELRGTSQQKRVYRSSGAQAPPLPVKSIKHGGGVTSMAPGTQKCALNKLSFHQSIRKKKPNYTKFPHHTEDISPMGSQKLWIRWDKK